jgi:hypothetical protein
MVFQCCVIEVMLKAILKVHLAPKYHLIDLRQALLCWAGLEYRSTGVPGVYCRDSVSV